MPLDAWLSDETLQHIALENNLSETALIVPKGDAYAIRWFTPTHVVFTFLRSNAESITFESHLSGTLEVAARNDGSYAMNFPAWHGKRLEAAPFRELLGVDVKEAFDASDLLLVLTSAEDVRSFNPDYALLTGVKEVSGKSNNNYVLDAAKINLKDLQEALRKITDPRDPQGRRYEFVPLLSLCISAVLSGYTQYR